MHTKQSYSPPKFFNTYYEVFVPVHSQQNVNETQSKRRDPVVWFADVCTITHKTQVIVMQILSILHPFVPRLRLRRLESFTFADFTFGYSLVYVSLTLRWMLTGHFRMFSMYNSFVSMTNSATNFKFFKTIKQFLFVHGPYVGFVVCLFFLNRKQEIGLRIVSSWTKNVRNETIS